MYSPYHGSIRISHSVGFQGNFMGFGGLKRVFQSDEAFVRTVVKHQIWTGVRFWVPGCPQNEEPLLPFSRYNSILILIFQSIIISITSITIGLTSMSTL